MMQRLCMLACGVLALVTLKLVDTGAAAKTPATAYFDNQYVEALEKEGFLKKLWP